MHHQSAINHDPGDQMKTLLLTIALLVALSAPATSTAGNDPGSITIEQTDTGTIIRFIVYPGVREHVTVTSTIPGTPNPAFDEDVDTTARTIPLEILSISGQLQPGTVVLQIGHWRRSERIKP
jgi:hypothetical protein